MKKAITVIAALVVLGAGYLYISRHNRTSPSTASSTSIATLPSGTSTQSVTSNDQAIRDQAWNVFERYLTYAKNNDFAGLKSLSYMTSRTCNDAASSTACHDLMQTVYFYGRDMKKDDFINVWYDSKQIILSSDYAITIKNGSFGATRLALYFTRDALGNPKVLYESPFDGFVLNNTDNQATSTMTARLKSLTTDTDEDGLPDAVETCANLPAGYYCTHTDPNKRDTYGDGLWDSIRYYINLRKENS